jgi:hypothetical protein
LNSIICEGINRRCKIQFKYEGETRVVEPFFYGINTKGNEVLRAFQTDGYSQSANPFGWRIYNVAKISAITLLNDSFDGCRSDYNKNDKQIPTLICNI